MGERDHPYFKLIGENGKHMGHYDTRTPHTSTLWVLRHCNPYTGRVRDAFLKCTRDWRTSGADHIFHHNDIRTFVHKHQTPSRPDKFLNI